MEPHATLNLPTQLESDIYDIKTIAVHKCLSEQYNTKQFYLILCKSIKSNYAKLRYTCTS